jgi:hypothetical protein
VVVVPRRRRGRLVEAVHLDGRHGLPRRVLQDSGRPHRVGRPSTRGGVVDAWKNGVKGCLHEP